MASVQSNETRFSNKIQFSNEEISFLQQKRNLSVLLLIGELFALGFGYFFYAADISDFAFAVGYAAIITAIFGSLIYREAGKISRLHSDLRGNFKIAVETKIEDFKEGGDRNSRGENLSPEYYIIAGGKKYAVKSAHYFKFGRGDTVRMIIAPQSRYAFDVEQIAVAEKSKEPELLFQLI